ncbi:MAG: hypothetical protein H0T15_08025 [Thermoleophilaceae bacterium]|nr:hypothetical protein [Thermoleophilaceae bacterium]
MGKRSRKREQGPREKPPSTVYTDPDGNVLELRDELSEGTRKMLEEPQGTAGASQEDLEKRTDEIRFERLAMSWTIAGLPIEKQKELLGRYRLASAEERAWISATIAEHLREKG